MSSSVTDPASDSTPTVKDASFSSPKNKGKGKASTNNEPMDEDEEEEEEEEEEGEGEEDEEEDESEQEAYDEIDPSAIVSGRRTRGVRVDYTSKEALEKAGLKSGDADDDDEDEDVDMQ